MALRSKRAVRTRKPALPAKATASGSRLATYQGSGKGRGQFKEAYYILAEAARVCHEQGLETFTRTELLDRLELPETSRLQKMNDHTLRAYLYRMVASGLIEVVRETSAGQGTLYRLVEEYAPPLFPNEGFAHELDWLRYFYQNVPLGSKEEAEVTRLKLQLAYQQLTGFRLDRNTHVLSAFSPTSKSVSPVQGSKTQDILPP